MDLFFYLARKIRVVQKNVIEEKLMEIKRCNYIGWFIPVARLESDRLLKHAQSLQLAGDKSHTILPGVYIFSRFVLGFSFNNYPNYLLIIESVFIIKCNVGLEVKIAKGI